MEDKTTPKVSFSLSPFSSSRPNHSAPQIFPRSDTGDEAEDGTEKPQFITSFDVSQTLIAFEDAKPISIPPIPNAKTKKVLPVPEDIEDYDKWKFWEDMKELPEHRGLEEFERVKIEDFAIAYLTGYGWSQKQVIGRNKMLCDPVVYEYTRRHGTAGLGYREPIEESLNPAETAAKK